MKQPRLITWAVVSIFGVLLICQSFALLWCSVAAHRGFIVDRSNSAQIFTLRNESCSQIQRDLNETAVKALNVAIGYAIGRSVAP